jgi:hypothetical protein
MDVFSEWLQKLGTYQPYINDLASQNRIRRDIDRQISFRSRQLNGRDGFESLLRTQMQSDVGRLFVIFVKERVMKTLTNFGRTSEVISNYLAHFSSYFIGGTDTEDLSDSYLDAISRMVLFLATENYWFHGWSEIIDKVQMTEDEYRHTRPLFKDIKQWRKYVRLLKGGLLDLRKFQSVTHFAKNEDPMEIVTTPLTCVTFGYSNHIGIYQMIHAIRSISAPAFQPWRTEDSMEGMGYDEEHQCFIKNLESGQLERVVLEEEKECVETLISRLKRTE